MPLFYFDVRHAVTVSDREGSEHSDLTGAIAEAREAAREMLADGVRSRQDRRSWVIEIRDGAGILWATTAFSDVLP